MKYIFFDCFNTLFATPTNLTIKDILRRMQDKFREEDISRIAESWNTIYKQLETQAFQTEREFLMKDISKIMSKKEPFYSKRTYDELTNCYMDEWESRVDIYSDVKDCIEEISKDYSLGVISNTHDKNLVHRIITKYGMDNQFAPIILSSDIGIRKPNKVIFSEAKKTKYEGKIIFVGDSYYDDIAGALNADMIPIQICRGMEVTMVKLERYYKINSLLLLGKLVSNI